LLLCTIYNIQEAKANHEPSYQITQQFIRNKILNSPDVFGCFTTIADAYMSMAHYEGAEEMLAEYVLYDYVRDEKKGDTKKQESHGSEMRVKGACMYVYLERCVCLCVWRFYVNTQ